MDLKRERSIGARLREFREELNISRSRFAVLIGYGSERIASYEFGRAPLPYEVFRAISKKFHISPWWLEGPDSTAPYFPGPFDDSKFIGSIRPRALFSEVFDSHIADPGASDSGAFASPEYHELLKHLMQFTELVEGLPENRRREVLSNRVVERLMEWVKRSEKAVRNSGGSQSKDKVDFAASMAILPSVTSGVPTWAELKKGVLKLTAEHGMKAWLADELEVSRQVLNNWLSTSGQGRPDAVNTLLLLRWVKGGGGKTKIPRK